MKCGQDPKAGSWHMQIREEASFQLLSLAGVVQPEVWQLAENVLSCNRVKISFSRDMLIHTN